MKTVTQEGTYVWYYKPNQNSILRDEGRLGFLLTALAQLNWERVNRPTFMTILVGQVNNVTNDQTPLYTKPLNKNYERQKEMK